MANAPRQKHSRTSGKPVTIDLAASESEAVPENPVHDTPEAETVAFDEPVAPETDTDTERDAPTHVTETAAPADKDGRSTPAGASTLAPPAGSRRGSAISGGIAGAVAALALAAAGQWAGLIPSPQRPPATDSVLQSQVAELAARIDALPVPQPQADTAALAEIPKVKSELSTLASKVGGFEKQLADTATAMAAAGDGSSPAIAAELAKLRNDVSALDARIEDAATKSAGATERAALAEQRAAALEEKMATMGGTANVAIPIAAAALKAAIDRGGTFAGELETYAGVSGDSQTVDELRTLAAAGVPTIAALQAEFDTAANAMIDALNAPDPSAGLVDRMLNSAKGLVRVRPVGEIEGETPEAMIARMEARLDVGDLAAALGEYEKLPEPAKTAGAAYAKKLRARIDVDTLVGAKLNAALGMTGK